MPQTAFNADALQQARASAGLTRTELAHSVGLNTGDRVATWERGLDQPTPKLIPLLAQALGVTPLDLLDIGSDGPTLADLRVAAGLTIQVLVDAAGISYGTYRRIERGALPPTPDSAQRIATALGISLAACNRAIAARSRR